MRPIDRINHYADLLIIRHNARQRDTIISGGLFFVSLLALIGKGLISGFGSSEIYIVAGLNVAVGLSFLMLWMRLEVIKASIETAENLLQALSLWKSDTIQGENK
jgi:hypothetical protein